LFVVFKEEEKLKFSSCTGFVLGCFFESCLLRLQVEALKAGKRLIWLVKGNLLCLQRRYCFDPMIPFSQDLRSCSLCGCGA
ncbi:MAG: hypothetical protein ACM3UN_05735, partial [Bacillota bacterium]